MDEKNKLETYLVQMTRFALEGKQADARLYLNRINYTFRHNEGTAFQRLRALGSKHSHIDSILRTNATAVVAQHDSTDRD